ncbi:transposase [Shewanella olleyana]|uniref:transposase n=1 Tax=Shewanella olleyana TaxID=135626 RepID=UPI00200E4BBC|nr:transposase [Shewanella olleyana]MCL1066851.1 transposase [Shewanella olleyana]
MTALNRIYSSELKQQVIKEVQQDNRLISDVAKRYSVSAKTIYQWVRKKETKPASNVNKSAITSEIAHLQRKLSQLNQQLVAINGN